MQDTKTKRVYVYNGEVLNNMAEGKKSFVLYTDLIEITEELTDKEAGLLFKTILRYVNDLNPEIPKEIKLAFIPIKQDLKRDLKKYEAQVERINRINDERKRKKLEQERNDIDTISHEVEGVNVNDNVNVNVNDISKDIVDIDSVEVKEFILELPTISSAKGNKYPIFQEELLTPSNIEERRIQPLRDGIFQREYPLKKHS